MRFQLIRSLSRLAAIVAGLAVPAADAHAQWVKVHEQFYLQAKHNWQFRARYQAADRLFNAFDYGHAILYETLWRKPNAPASALEETEYDFLTKTVLVKPPRLPLEEGAIEIAYVKLAPEAKAMFEWAHVLHRQLYDVLGDERLTEAEKDGEVARLLAYYKTRPDVAFSSRPKSMALMQEQPYSLAFRQRYPKFNALIWSYHWLQVGLYEPLLTGTTSDERQSLVRATVSRFWQMLKDPPRTMPYQMPMTAAVAPKFAERYEEAAIIFDNLHSMHDVISDILANPEVPRDRKRSEIVLAARRYRDDTSYVVTPAAWRTMAQHMGLENMGGPAVGFLPALPTPTVTYGAVMLHDERTGAMTGFSYGQATGGAHGGHVAGAAPGQVIPADPAHAAHAAGAAPAAKPRAADTSHAGHAMPAAPMAMSGDSSMLDLHTRMLNDPVIRRRIQADSTLKRLMLSSLESLPSEHRSHLEMILRDSASAGADRIEVEKERAAPGRATRATSATPTKTPSRPAARPVAKPPAKAPAKPAPKPDPHAGHKIPPSAGG